MIHSMTGFGKAITELPNRKITVEIKSLNSKQLDLSTRIPQQYREMEMEIRSEIAKRLERGKVDFFVYSEAIEDPKAMPVSIFIENIGRDACTQLNMPVIEGYYQQIKEASETLKIALPTDWFQTLLRLPESMKTDTMELEDNDPHGCIFSFALPLSEVILNE